MDKLLMDAMKAQLAYRKALMDLAGVARTRSVITRETNDLFNELLGGQETIEGHAKALDEMHEGLGVQGSLFEIPDTEKAA